MSVLAFMFLAAGLVAVGLQLRRLLDTLKVWEHQAKQLAEGTEGIRFSQDGLVGGLGKELTRVAKRLETASRHLRAYDETATDRLIAKEHENTKLAESNTAARSLLQQLEWQNSALTNLNNRLIQLAYTDGLTGLKNHRTFQELFRGAFSSAKRYRLPLSLLMIDLDQFKTLNDLHGHPAGDKVLKHAATMISSRVRESDIVARYGGEEFALVLPNTDVTGAMSLAEQLREEMPRNSPYPFTVSVGVAEIGDTIATPDQLLSLADDSLYEAKRSGRDRVVSAQLSRDLRGGYMK